jgi:hypothetical protein
MHHEYCGVILEFMMDHDLWILQVFFGMACCHNDISMLQRSPVFAKLIEGHAPSCNYKINIHQYTKGYYLADDIYPKWDICEDNHPACWLEQVLVCSRQESYMKDVERTFGLTQARFATIRYPALSWS